MPIIRYRVIPFDVESEDLPEDPAEEWVQDGVNYPQGKPPAGVQSSTDVIPEMRPPNFVPPDPLPTPHVEEVVPDAPAEEEYER